ncbi:MAG TPA: antibiotic biosynthesis monooxygenase [Candidatus Polarisedimenticolia bacterium]|nr:antibiotic biosynthesis monooxygenase [Candidatus Polarisedimenticolia bacterium]
MIARVWQGVVPLAKAEAYGRYLSDSERGVGDYRRLPGNRGALLLRRDEGDRSRFLLISLWESRQAIEAYAGKDIDRAQYFPFDRDCLLDPDPEVAHYEVLSAPGLGGD